MNHMKTKALVEELLSLHEDFAIGLFDCGNFISKSAIILLLNVTDGGE